jgi:hypothetical protein
MRAILRAFSRLVIYLAGGSPNTESRADDGTSASRPGKRRKAGEGPHRT